MRIFIPFMLIVIMSTIIHWHLYDNKDQYIYEKKRKLFMEIIITEFIISFFALIIYTFKK
jgi:hypothetical protein